MDNTVSFRQVGKEVSGRVFKGPVASAFNRQSQPSIPTINENFLSEASKPKGFGTCAERFSQSTKSLLGPGHYKPSESTENPSHSKKGYGGFVSSSSRFRRFKFNSAVPGPGSYNSKKPKTATSFVFRGRSKDLLKPQAPDPGHYNPETVSSKSSLTSVFKSNIERIQETKNEVPPPWHYNPKLPRSSSAQLSSYFQGSVNARRYQINLYDPTQPTVQESMPGPGHYKTETQKLPNRSSSFFVSGIDRFGKALKQKKQPEERPGPGTYIKPSTTQEKFPVTGAVFMSETERNWVAINKKPPGPAFYKPNPVPKKKNFHLNSNKLWM